MRKLNSNASIDDKLTKTLLEKILADTENGGRLRELTKADIRQLIDRLSEELVDKQ